MVPDSLPVPRFWGVRHQKALRGGVQAQIHGQVGAAVGHWEEEQAQDSPGMLQPFLSLCDFLGEIGGFPGSA